MSDSMEGGPARPAPAMRVLALCALAAPILWALDPFGAIRPIFFLEQFLALELGVSLALVFWTQGKGQRSVLRRFADRALGGLSLLVCIWIALRYEAYIVSVAGAEPVALSVAIIGLCILACPRVAGMPMSILISGFLIYGYVAQFLSGPLTAPRVQFDSYMSYLGIGGDALFGIALNIISTMVVVFVVFGKAFEFSGGSDFIARLATSVTRRSRGAPIKVAVVASGILGSITGSVVSNVMTSGSFSIPMMRRIGFPAHRAAGVEAVSSTGGQLMPPVMGAAAFLMVDMAGVGYGDLILAAAVPGLLFYLAIFLQVDGLAARLKMVPAGDEKPAPWRQLTREGLIYLIPVAVLVGGLFRYDYAPERGALLGIAGALAVGAFRAKSWRRFATALLDSASDIGVAAARLVVTGGAIGIMLGVINSTGLGVAMAISVSELSEYGLFATLIAAAFACYVLGLGMATTAVYVIVGTLIAPGLIRIGIEPIAAHLFVFYMAMLSMITPPIAFACLAASSLAGASFLRTCLAAMHVGWIIFLLPFLFVIYPELLLIGNLWAIAGTLFVVVIAIVLVCAGVSGYAKERLSWTLRLACFVVAALILAPQVPLEAKILLAFIAAAVLWRDRWRAVLALVPGMKP